MKKVILFFLSLTLSLLFASTICTAQGLSTVQRRVDSLGRHDLYARAYISNKCDELTVTRLPESQTILDRIAQLKQFVFEGPDGSYSCNTPDFVPTFSCPDAFNELKALEAQLEKQNRLVSNWQAHLARLADSMSAKQVAAIERVQLEIDSALNSTQLALASVEKKIKSSRRKGRGIKKLQRIQAELQGRQASLLSVSDKTQALKATYPIYACED